MKLRILSFTILSVIIFACSSGNPLLKPDSGELKQPAPEYFKVIFHTTKGNFTVEVSRKYSPLGVDRFYYLVKNHYYDGNRFFRVVPNFVVQWGMIGIPEVDKFWEKMGIKDEPVKLSNRKGTMAFARGGPDTRSNQLFINLKDNLRLDTTNYMNVKGFPAFGKVIKGMKVVESINPEYIQKPNQDSIMVKGNSYLKKNFPDLDYIISTELMH